MECGDPAARLRRAGLVAVGGAGGATARFVVDGLAHPLVATLAVNVAGSFALGLLIYGAVIERRLSREARLLLATGFLASLTTYSTFAFQTATHPSLALGYVAVTYALGFGAVVVAARLVRSDRDRRKGVEA